MSGQSGLKAVVQLGSGTGPITYATVGKITGDISIPKPDVTEIDTTNHSSPGGYKESILGLRSGGSFDVTLLLEDDDTMRATLHTAIDDGAICDWRILWPSGAIASDFQGWAVAGGETFPLDDKAEYTLTIHVTGPIAETTVS